MRLRARAGRGGAFLALALAAACASSPARREPERGPAPAGPADAAAARPARPERLDAAPERPAEPSPEASGGERRPRARSARAAPSTAPPHDVAASPAALRRAVSDAASDRGLPAQGALGALRAIASTLAVAAGGDRAALAAIDRMRANLERLDRLGPVDLDRADRVRDALGSGVEALRAVARGGASPGLDDWVEEAARAAKAVDPATPLGLQRAPVQDALRALADAVLVAEQRAGG